MENGERPMFNEKELDVIIRETTDWLDQGESFTYSLNQVLNRYNLNSRENFSEVREEMTNRSLVKRTKEEEDEYEAELLRMQEEEKMQGAREHEAFHKHRTQDD